MLLSFHLHIIFYAMLVLLKVKYDHYIELKNRLKIDTLAHIESIDLIQ